MLLSKCEFHEHQSRDSHTLLRGMNKFLPILSIFSAILGKISKRKLQFNILSFMKPGSVQNILSEVVIGIFFACFVHFLTGLNKIQCK
jgi:hypothetical protein